jgi:formylglycine-generating enzyme required for sulfatase activity
MSGNVWEWTNTIYADYPYQAGDGRESRFDTTSARALRGGSWAYSDPLSLRGSSRHVWGPLNRDFGLGFRVGYAAPGTRDPR